MGKVRFLPALAAVAITAVAVLCLLRGRAPAPAPDSASAAFSEGVPASKARPDTSREMRSSASGRVAARAPLKEKPVIEVDDDDDEPDEHGMVKTQAEKDLLKRIEKALDEEVIADAIACAAEAQKCRITEIRQAMVDTLGWFGEKAIPELTPFLADADEDVRDSAMNEWSMAVSSIENEVERLGTVELAMSVLNDEDALEEISGEYIGADEKTAVESLMRVIEGGASANGVEKAKETYEFVTGEEWEGVAAAEKWIREEYQPDGE